jgi:hypothetical protein
MSGIHSLVKKAQNRDTEAQRKRDLKQRVKEKKNLNHREKRRVKTREAERDLNNETMRKREKSLCSIDFSLLGVWSSFPDIGWHVPFKIG